MEEDVCFLRFFCDHFLFQHFENYYFSWVMSVNAYPLSKSPNCPWLVFSRFPRVYLYDNLLWPPVQMINFSIVPSQYRSNTTKGPDWDVCNIMWRLVWRNHPIQLEIWYSRHERRVRKHFPLNRIKSAELKIVCVDFSSTGNIVV